MRFRVYGSLMGFRRLSIPGGRPTFIPPGGGCWNFRWRTIGIIPPASTRNLFWVSIGRYRSFRDGERCWAFVTKYFRDGVWGRHVYLVRPVCIYRVSISLYSSFLFSSATSPKNLIAHPGTVLDCGRNLSLPFLISYYFFARVRLIQNVFTL